MSYCESSKSLYMYSLSLKSGSSDFGNEPQLQLIRGGTTLYLPLVQPDRPATVRGRGRLSGALPEPHQVQPLHFRGEQIPIGERGTGSSVLPVEKVHLKGELFLL